MLNLWQADSWRLGDQVEEHRRGLLREVESERRIWELQQGQQAKGYVMRVFRVASRLPTLPVVLTSLPLMLVRSFDGGKGWEPAAPGDARR